MVFVIMGTIFWYVIQFTATFGWKVSWTWWYSGILAIFLQFAVFDPAISVLNYLLYRAHEPSGRFVLRIRSVTQAYNELFELSDEDAREVQRNFRPAKARPVGALTIDPENPPISGPAKPEDAVE